jgi:uncharacterized protein (TIGR00266 family)
MDNNWNNRPGQYLGEPPQGRGGFGRKRMPLNSAPDGFTLSQASQASQPYQEKHFAQPEVPNDIEFAISDGDMQYIEIEFDPGEAIVADNGAMIWKDDVIAHDLLLGDGSKRNEGFGSRLLNAGMNILSGEDLFVAEYHHAGTHGKARMALGGAIPGHIIPVRLDAMGGTLICQRSAFLAAAKGVQISIAFQKRIMTGIFGGEGFIMQRLTGNGWVFLHVGGTMIERDLAPGEVIQVDTGCVAAYEPQVDMDVVYVGGIKKAVFGDEGLFYAVLRGPGKVWLQTLPFSRLAAETVAEAPGSGRGSARGGEVDVFDGIDALRKLF